MSLFASGISPLIWQAKDLDNRIWGTVFMLTLDIAFFFWDIGIDLLVGRQQIEKTFPDYKFKDTTVRERVNYLFSSRVAEEYDMEAVHLLLTWSWIILGAVGQFLTACFLIRKQDYLPIHWKCVVVVSSMAMMGPTMLYVYCISLIVSYKMMKTSNPPSPSGESSGSGGSNRTSGGNTNKSEIMRRINRALAFANLCKLAEIFLESFPQFLTQIAMTSAKGNDGARVLTPVQTLSVVSSAITIILGISHYVIGAGGRYFSTQHAKMASQLLIILVVGSEVCFCGGIFSFSFAFHGTGSTIPLVAVVTPFAAVSSILAMLQLVSDKFRFRFGEYAFLVFKLAIWAILLAIFFSQISVEKAANDLHNNNSYYTFVVTMTLISLVNFVVGFLLRHQESDFGLYSWIDSVLANVAMAMVDRSVEPELNDSGNEKWMVDDGKCVSDKKAGSVSSIYTVPSPAFSVSEYRYPAVQGEPGKDSDSKGEESKKLEAIESKDVAKNGSALSIDSGLGLDANGTAVQVVTPNNDHAFKKYPQSFLCSTIWFFLFFGILVAILAHPLAYKREPYHLDFVAHIGVGFPVVASSNITKRGSLCVKGRTPDDILKLGWVIARQMKFDYGGWLPITILVGDVRYQDELAESLEVPFLQPLCNGQEDNIVNCKDHGLGVGLHESCYEGMNRLNVQFMRIPYSNPPPYFFFLNSTEMTFPEAQEFCRNIGSMRYDGKLDSITTEKSTPITSHIFSEVQSDLMRKISNGILKMYVSEIWLHSGKYLNGLRAQTFWDAKGENKTRPVLCTIYNHAYPVFCEDNVGNAAVGVTSECSTWQAVSSFPDGYDGPVCMSAMKANVTANGTRLSDGCDCRQWRCQD